MDFGFESTSVQPNDGSQQPQPDPVIESGSGEEPKDINSPNEPNPQSNPEPNKGAEDENGGDDKGDDSKKPFEAGTVIEFEGVSYTATEAGDLVDDKGNIFKKADEINDWLKEVNVDDTDSKSSVIDIEQLQKALNISLVDDNDKPVQFENSIEGVKSFIESVIEQSREIHYDEGVKQLFATYPIVQDFLNYYVANGNSYEGFGGKADRTDVQFDADNEAQHIAIIKTAWEERNVPGNVDNYIEYLKNTNNLAATAELELEALKKADAEYKKQLAEEASKKEAEQIEYERAYWSGIQKKINEGTIGNYKIPEVISITRDGQKVNVTRNHFFEYLYHRDKDGYSRYQRDIQNMKQEDIDNDQLVRAYLMFTGGNYDSLVDMAIRKKELSAIKVKITKKQGSVRVTPPSSGGSGMPTDFGY